MTLQQAAVLLELAGFAHLLYLGTLGAPQLPPPEDMNNLDRMGLAGAAYAREIAGQFRRQIPGLLAIGVALAIQIVQAFGF